MTVTVIENEADTKSTMFSTREIPWMKLGKLIDEPKTAVEAAKLGGLDFIVEQRPLWFGNSVEADAFPDSKITSRVANVRVDTGEMLSIVSKDYPVLQYSDAFNFMDTISPTYLAAGALKGGRQGFMVIKAPDYVVDVLGGDDPHGLFIVLRTSHDCSRAVEASVMPLRKKCMNQLTLNVFSHGAKQRWSIKHTSTMNDKLKEAQHSLTNLANYGKAYEELAYRLVDIKVSDSKAETILKKIMPNRPKRDDKIIQIMNAWHNSETVGFDWTGWGLVNAVSEYFEWLRPGGNLESRFVGALQGPSYHAINRTVQYVLAA